MSGDAEVAPGDNGETPTERRPQGILFWSTAESAAEGRITVLACVETVLAMSVTAYITWRTHSLLYIAVPASVAPLLLLRTPHSTTIGLTLLARYDAWVSRINAWDDRMIESRSVLQPLSAASFTVVAFSSSLPALVCRIAAVGTAILRHPLTTLGAIPGNWRRVALSTDLHHPPEIIPGCENDDAPTHFRFTEIFRLMRGSRNWSGGGTLLVVWFVPALFYRWSLKSTTLVYFPLLWAAFKSRRGADTPAQRLTTIATDQAERFVRWYAGFVLIFLTIVPAVLAAPLQPIIAPVQSALGVELVGFWLFTGQIKLWHLVRAFNAVITIGLFLFADKALRRIKSGRAHSDTLVHAIIGSCLFVRGFFGVYLSAKLLHIVVTAVDWSAVDWRIIFW